MTLYLLHGDGTTSTADVNPDDWPHLRVGGQFDGARIVAIAWNVTLYGPAPFGGA